MFMTDLFLFRDQFVCVLQPGNMSDNYSRSQMTAKDVQPGMSSETSTKPSEIKVTEENSQEQKMPSISSRQSLFIIIH